jgi:hypothetical protein
LVCVLDGAAATSCASPVSYTGLADGTHTFSVRARDRVGNTSSARTATWVVDTTAPPTPTIGSRPDGATSSSAAELSFADSEFGATLLCSLDGSAQQPCASPAPYSGLAAGTHIFSVVARDAAGNTSDAAKAAWAVQPDYVSNGSFEGSLAGWSSAAGTLSLASDGIVGSSAAKVTVARTDLGWVSIFPSPRPVQGTVSGSIYRASAWVRSDAPANSVCLRIREYTPGNSLVNTVAECTTSSQQWQRFPTMTYTPTTVGNVVTAFVYEPSPVAGGTYEVDGVSIIGGPPALFAGNGDPVLLAGGDVACAPDSPSYNFGLGTGTKCMHRGTTALIGTVPGLQYLLPLGDQQYECGELSNFNSVYDLTWGRYRSISRPVPGNHEYGVTSSGACPATTHAEGYFAYFGAIAGDPTKGYYSYDIGNWHVVALNSTCVVVSCAAGSPQEVWLRNDLAAHPAKCTLAYWHQPRWSTGQVGDEPQYDAFTRDLVNAHVELMLSGHDHTYQRWTPMNAAGAADPNGVREVVAGTGGEELFSILGSRPTLEAANNTTFGLVQLVLHPNGYDAQFVATAGGGFTDTFSGSCH